MYHIERELVTGSTADDEYDKLEFDKDIEMDINLAENYAQQKEKPNILMHKSI